MPVPARIDLSAISEDRRYAVAALLREHGALVGENSALKDETASLKEIVKRLEHLVAEPNHRAERLDIVPAQLRVIVTVRPKYACRACTDGVRQAPAPAALIEGGLPTEGAVAHVLVGKYADHLPLHRQSRILARAGIDIHRSTLADWVGVAGFHLGPVVDRLAEHLKASTKLFIDGEPRARH